MNAIREPQAMTDDESRGQQRFRWLLTLLTVVWAAVTFLPPLLAREVQFEVMGLPFALWMAAQGAPIVYVILVWVCERRASRLEDARRAERTAPGNP
jgi:putative solute:sodium symporter small subunit